MPVWLSIHTDSSFRFVLKARLLRYLYQNDYNLKRSFCSIKAEMLARSKRYIKEAILSVRYQLNQSSVCIRLRGSVLSGRRELSVPRYPPLGRPISGPSHLLCSSEYTAWWVETAALTTLWHRRQDSSSLRKVYLTRPGTGDTLLEILMLANEKTSA